MDLSTFNYISIGSVNFSLVGIYTNLIPKSFFSFFTIFMYKTKQKYT